MNKTNLKRDIAEVWRNSLPLTALVSLLAVAVASILVQADKIAEGGNGPLLVVVFSLPWILTVLAYVILRKRFLSAVLVVIASVLTYLESLHFDWQHAPLIAMFVFTLITVLLSKEIADRKTVTVDIALKVATAWALFGGTLAFLFQDHTNNTSAQWYPTPDLSVQMGWLFLAGTIAGIILLFINPRLSFALAVVTLVPVLVGPLNLGFGHFHLALWVVFQSVISVSITSLAIGAGAIVVLRKSTIAE